MLCVFASSLQQKINGSLAQVKHREWGVGSTFAYVRRYVCLLVISNTFVIDEGVGLCGYAGRSCVCMSGRFWLFAKIFD